MDTTFPRIERLPPYVFNVIGDMRQTARAAGKDVIDFSMGNPDQPTPPHIVKKLVETAERDDTHRYSQSKGIPRLRLAMSNWYKTRYNVDLDPEPTEFSQDSSGIFSPALACSLTPIGNMCL